MNHTFVKTLFDTPNGFLFFRKLCHNSLEKSAAKVREKNDLKKN
ncbi:hypothetical protein M128_1182 [Bacteroides fragilis str. S6L8]|uniref:Uncharacterized protein n=1 Tax=Bacteroides fragilis str. S36L11 TaxID=1339327 RepID=A0A015Z4D6_BACFG|nr:hypothetical protein M122_1051 [Bacteroides fragilis str. 3976T7]EXY61365.1 hypothetical protein M111_1049 [Bacteroides fragilis str. 3986T(B)10]EXZ01593.1 hypothetical protein M074_1184 [Bacteroides fragilis str. DS-166]EXZ15018.1 hypothetical protein M071_1058 [Bacteroides fragilis str. Ds-233]EXZ29664.1 hypothetical protein M136_1110 [Bacteroides fragilis str. S36L11]EYA06009.1 hypothetical protein M126_1116 [Bacteroides fragilis str. S6L3]EYA86868.1 hypothetical protein M137_1316 [Bact